MSNGFNTDGLFTYPASEGFVENPITSIECAIAFDVADWSELGRRAAWVYHIVFGVDDDEEYITFLNKKFHWDGDDIARLRRLHEKWEKLKNESDNQ